MPFLFIDYDQGAGGEFFAAKLSESDQCVTLQYEHFPNGRTKTYDCFGQEFLNSPPRIQNILQANQTLYDIVLTHQYTFFGKKLLDDVYSLRIATPDKNDKLYDFYHHQKLKKILLSQIPKKLFAGEIRSLAKISKNPNFLKEINSKMDTLDLILVSKDIVPNKENKDNYINNLINSRHSEPKFNYDLVIAYRDLFYDVNKVKQSIFDTFGIEIINDWLDTYRQNYEAWISQT
jgi:hypothetical protein